MKIVTTVTGVVVLGLVAWCVLVWHNADDTPKYGAPTIYVTQPEVKIQGPVEVQMEEVAPVETTEIVPPEVEEDPEATPEPVAAPVTPRTPSRTVDFEIVD